MVFYLAVPSIARAVTLPEEELLTILNPSVQSMVERAFPDAPIMVSIARAESQFVATAKNPNSSATGVFQILIGTWQAYGCEGSRTNATDNIACARKIYDRDGTAPWLASYANW